MFSFMKRRGMKSPANDNKSNDSTVISTKNMTTGEYVAAIEDKLLDVLCDRSALSRFGVRDLFSGNERVHNNISFEDACYCMNVIEMVLDRISYVSDVFMSKYETADESFFTAANLATLCKEASEHVGLSNNTRTIAHDKLISSINTNLEFLPTVQTNAFKTIVFSARTMGYDMGGF